MARRLRLFVPDLPYHVVQRGNNRNPIFFSDKDYLFFLDVLLEAKNKYPCFIYAYCLMPNHFHLLIKPKEANNISLLMKLLGAKYVHYVNKYYKRTGTLWEGRFKCSLIDEEAYLLSCLHYIEMNPLRARICELPEKYRWSSYRFRVSGEKNSILDFGQWYNNFGHTMLERQLCYRQSLQNSVPQTTLDLIRKMTDKCGIIASNGFTEQLEKLLGRELLIRPIGRPRSLEK